VLQAAKREHFFDEGNQGVFEVIRDLDVRQFDIEMQLVRTEIMKTEPKLMDALTKIIMVEQTAAVMFAVESLEEWQKKRDLFRGLSIGLQDLKEGISSLQCANDISKVVDTVSISSVDDFTSYAMLKKKLENEPPIAKLTTGLSFLDVKLRGGIEYGQFIGVMGDPEAGKTVLVTQIIKHVSSLGLETLFFNFEFHYRSFIENNKLNENKFSLEKFLMESDNNDILDIEAKIKIFAKRGGKVIAIDSQMMITNIRNTGTSSERETEKFFILQRLAIKYELIIMLIAQQGKEDTRSGTVSPMGSKNAAHALHQIWYIKKPKLEFNEDGEDEHKGERTFVVYKNKQTGIHFNKPMKLDPRSFEFRGVQFDEDDVRSTKTVGSGRKHAPQEVLYEMEDAEGRVSALEDPGLWEKQDAEADAMVNVEMPTI